MRSSSASDGSKVFGKWAENRLLLRVTKSRNFGMFTVALEGLLRLLKIPFSRVFSLARSCQNSKAASTDEQTDNHQRHEQADGGITTQPSSRNPVNGASP
jgi:hypothetical protein